MWKRVQKYQKDLNILNIYENLFDQSVSVQVLMLFPPRIFQKYHIYPHLHILGAICPQGASEKSTNNFPCTDSWKLKTKRDHGDALKLATTPMGPYFEFK